MNVSMLCVEARKQREAGSCSRSRPFDGGYRDPTERFNPAREKNVTGARCVAPSPSRVVLAFRIRAPRLPRELQQPASRPSACPNDILTGHHDLMPAAFNGIYGLTIRISICT